MISLRTFLPLLLAFLAAASGVRAAEAADAPHPVVSALEAEGAWKVVEPPKTYRPENLYEEIDGEAELFLPYGMRSLTVAILERSSEPAAEVRMEAFRMATPRDAFGIWSQNRYPDQEILRLPSSEAVISDTSADFFRGDTYIRLRAKPGGTSRDRVAGLAAAVSGLLPGSGDPPVEARILAALPRAVAGSVIYQKRSMLGYECLAPGYEAARAPPPDRVRYLLLPAAVDRLPRLSRDLPGFREADGSLYRADLPSGPAWFSRAGACLVGIAGNLTREDAGRSLAGFADSATAVCGPSRERQPVRPLDSTDRGGGEPRSAAPPRTSAGN